MANALSLGRTNKVVYPISVVSIPVTRLTQGMSDELPSDEGIV